MARCLIHRLVGCDCQPGSTVEPDHACWTWNCSNMLYNNTHTCLETSSSHWWIIWVSLSKCWRGCGFPVNRNKKQWQRIIQRSECVGICTDASKVLSNSSTWLGRPQAMLHEVHWAWSWQTMEIDLCMTDTYPAWSHWSVSISILASICGRLFHVQKYWHLDINNVKAEEQKGKFFVNT